MSRKTICKEKFLTDAKGIQIGEDYHEVYRHFCKHFQQIEHLDRQQVVIGISLIYSWMPTIPNIDFAQLEVVVVALEKLRNGHALEQNALVIMKACINNSLVGVSKLLHFLCPNRFPIWDSRVARYFLEREPYQAVNNFDYYEAYIAFCKEVGNDPLYKPVHEQVQRKIGYDITYMRSVEYIMFLKGRKTGQN